MGISIIVSPIEHIDTVLPGVKDKRRIVNLYIGNCIKEDIAECEYDQDEGGMNFDLRSLLEQACSHYEVQFSNKNAVDDTLSFIMERLRAWYASQGVSADIFAAVLANYPTKPLEFEYRIKNSR